MEKKELQELNDIDVMKEKAIEYITDWDCLSEKFTSIIDKYLIKLKNATDIQIIKNLVKRCIQEFLDTESYYKEILEKDGYWVVNDV